MKKTIVHAVRGATVASVAAKYKVTAANVAQWNNVGASASFKAKQAVILFLPQSQANKAASAERNAEPAARKTKAVAARPAAPAKKTRKKK